MIANDDNISLDKINQWADFWYYEIGVNVIPANTREKNTFEPWTPWQDKSIPSEVHKERKINGDYKYGIAIIPGKRLC